jgi:carboxypeptidase N regulatory subunit
MNFPNLQVAYLGSNSLTTDSLDGGAFFDLNSLTSLTMNSNNFTSIPNDAFTGLENVLSQLNLEGNMIGSFPKIETLSKLTSLNLDSNKIETILEQMELPDSLAILGLNYNPDLSTIPTGGINVTSLDISHCAFYEIPDLTNYPKLNTLLMDGNDFLTMTDDGFTLHASDFNPIQNLRTFSCKQCSLNDVDPHAFYNLSSLTSVSFTANNLTRPRGEWFQQNYNIQTVGMTGNPWNCDCHSISYKILIDENQSDGSYNPFARSVKCNNPSSLSKYYIDQVSYNQLYQTGICPKIPSNFTTSSPSTNT